MTVIDLDEIANRIAHRDGANVLTPDERDALVTRVPSYHHADDIASWPDDVLIGVVVTAEWHRKREGQLHKDALVAKSHADALAKIWGNRHAHVAAVEAGMHNGNERAARDRMIADLKKRSQS